MNSVEVVDSLARVPAERWNRLAGGDPFLSHEFLSALHETGCASSATGWIPQYLLLGSAAAPAGALPLYVKEHSFGEYVFDWAWADAYHRHGLAYYPKLLCAIPFTPVTGSRVLATTDADRDRLIRSSLDLARRLQVSSLHCLFPTPSDVERLLAHGMMPRTTVQFHWKNRGYADFDEFLRTLFDEKLEADESAKAAAGWDGDRYVLYGKPGMADAVVWVSTWDTPEDADQAEGDDEVRPRASGHRLRSRSR